MLSIIILSDNSNPQPNPRKQTSLWTDTFTSPKHFEYPSSPYTEASAKFGDKHDQYFLIDGLVHDKRPPTKAFPTATPAEINEAKKAFFQIRDELALNLVRDIDENVMAGKLSGATATTGGVKLEWSTRLRTAAGRAHWSLAKLRPSGQTVDQHNLKIELSTKIITSEGPFVHRKQLKTEKLRDTLAHELCHCAIWVIDHDPHSHHGKTFKQWSSSL